MAFAEVAVNAAMPVRQTFTYRIPDGLGAAVGHAVYVPFGERTLQGVVLEVTETPAFAEARDLGALIDPQPLLLPRHAVLARWLSDYYLAPLFDCVSLMLPPGFKQKPLTYLRPLVSGEELERLDLGEAEREALSALIASGGAELGALAKALHLRSPQRLVSGLLRRGLTERSYRLARPRARPKVVPHLRLLLAPDQAREEAGALAAGSSRGERAAAALRLLAEEGPLLPVSEVRARARLTPAALRGLLEREAVALEQVTVIRDPLAGRVYPQRAPPTLTSAQEEAYREIAAALTARDGARPSFLLHGVTGSGKTEVYLQTLARAIELGKRAIVLVPEISLTPQTVRRFAERFPGQVAVMHSGLSLGEHFDMWQEVRRGRYAVVIGPRGAVFAPQPDLGLVIIDEEHEWTYKQQEQSPRYHARRMAEELCRLTGAVLVLGSATPDAETYQKALDGRHRLLTLPQRLHPTEMGTVAVSPLPAVEVVDLREELRAGNRSIFSRSLAAAVRSALSAGEQVILFLNRRGAASFLQCRDCGYVPRCSGCAVSLTYHSLQERLVCHHCNRSKRAPTSCPQCGGPRLRLMGIGTEKLEEEVRCSFPGARTLRWDRDVARSHAAHERILARFLAHEADILIGTQMLAKGLDLPLVTLVGVISADVALHLPDFRSGERTFQVLEQVAGRAGRGPRGGRVIIQTYTPQHPAVQAAARHDYAALVRDELNLRRRLGYPPFGRLARLTFAHRHADYAQREAFRMVGALKEERDRRGVPGLDVLGPAPGFVPRVRGRYYWHVTLRGGDPAELLRELTLPQGWTVDIDPVSLL
ncbi:MAG: primosomal protein N' [Chloroflexi bacterium]|nr:primosomal protein N' [Chloroflexota bacterium]